MDSNLKSKKIILFDGVCNLCNGFIDFVIRNDKSKTIYFTSLQADISKPILKEFEIVLDEQYSTIYFYRDGKLFDRSTAVLNVLKELNPYYRFFANVCLLVPKFIRNFVYKMISKNRYKLFGKRNTCRLPTQEEKNQFI